MWNFAKDPKSNNNEVRACPDCRLPLTDPAWLMCPRCRAVLSVCGGCSDCGKCGKKGS